MWVAPNKVPAFPKGREDNTHLNVYGGRVVAGLAVDAIAKAVPELAKYVRHYNYVVAQDGSGDFFTIQEAIDAVPDFRKDVRTTILVRKGIYKEKVVIPESKINISLIRRMFLERPKELPDHLPAIFMLLIFMRRTSPLKILPDLLGKP